MRIKRNRTPSKYIGYGLYLYFLGLSYRCTSKALSQFAKRIHVAIWKWMQKYRSKKITAKRKRIFEFIIDETLSKIGSSYMWIWATIEPKGKEILGISMSNERNMLTDFRTAYLIIDKQICKAPCFHRWRHMVSPTKQIIEYTSSYSFFT